MIKITGINEALAALSKLEKLDGRVVTPSETFTPKFLIAHTKFTNFDDFCGAIQPKVRNETDLGGLPDGVLDSFVKNNSDFGSWISMRNAAASAWAADQVRS